MMRIPERNQMTMTATGMAKPMAGILPPRWCRELGATPVYRIAPSASTVTMSPSTATTRTRVPRGMGARLRALQYSP